MQLIKENLVVELEAIIGMLFAGNRIMDRIKSQLNVKFVMPNTANYIHLQMSHKMPLLADEIGDYLEDRNVSEGYPATIADYSIYANSHECFVKMIEYFIDLEKIIASAIVGSLKCEDYTTEKFLNQFLVKIIPYTKDAVLLLDASDRYGWESKDDMQYDSNILKILGGE